ncbi:MAG: hypothetical protein MUO89_08960 [Dehalococcoidia bacterium]|nr:hypothetical protein [Dehalococcoidia bacterium]
MDIGWFRDLVICISGLVITFVVIFIAVLAYLLYSKVRPVLDSVKATSATLNEITSTVKDEVVKPVVSFVTLIRGIVQGIELASRLFKKEEREGGCNG